ncbi:MAG: apolipoprotein A1/A4/E family protein [Pleurocapsa sp. SU_5_0]|nr:apolipoprotein A1/A4/E family protein [Pleurocapsa sp. SU_5_0]NJR46520.1 apolipoprotein A1/A4/E family protein [Hyellaceae cyanobacterium CSU_1_1]
MTNIQIESDLKDILNKLDQKLDNIGDRLTRLETGQATIEGKIEAVDQKLSGKIEAVDQKLSGKIEAVDQKLSGKIEAADQKLSGKIQTLDTKVEQLDKRISNSELTNRGILIGLVVIILGGAAKFFGFMGNS